MMRYCKRRFESERPAAGRPSRGRPSRAAAAVIRRCGAAGGALLLLLSTAPALAPATSLAAPGSWVVLLDDGFEGSFPTETGWQLRSLGAEQYTWFNDTFKPHGGANSVWCADLAGDTFPNLEPETDDYPNDMFGRMMWGPFDLSDATAAEVEFWFWLDSESSYDFFRWTASADTLAGFDGFEQSGLPSGWESRIFDLAALPQQGSLLGQPAVWIAFEFESDFSITRQGAFVDDVIVRKFTGGGTPICSVSPTIHDFGEVQIGGSSDQTITIQNTGGGRLTGNLSESCADFELLGGTTYDLGAGDAVGIVLRFTPATGGLQTCTIDTGNGICSDVVVRGTGTAGGPNCAVTPTSHDFGQLGVGQSSDLTVQIRNAGTGGTLSGTVSETCADFEVVGPATYNLAQGETIDVTVRFAPASTGAKTCTIDTGPSTCSDVLLQGTAVNNTAPVIQHMAVTTAGAGAPLTLGATITDVESVPTATLFYRRGGDPSFASLAMTAVLVTFTGTIPDTAVTARGLEYYISATDGALVSTDPAGGGSAPYTVSVESASLTAPSAQPAGSEQNAYRMFSAPGLLDDPSAATVLFDDFGAYDDRQWRLFRYAGGAFHEYPAAESDSIEIGRAYWLITRQSGRVIGSGSGRSASTAADFVITLEPGWNDIALPFDFPVDWSDVQVNAGVVDGPYTYSGTWLPPSQVARLEPWQGYAVRNNGTAAETLRIPARAAAGGRQPATGPAPAPSTARGGSAAASGAPAAAWSIRLRARCAAAADLFNDLGWAAGAAPGKDARDFFEPRPIGDHVALSFPHDAWWWPPGAYTSDFRPPRPLAGRPASERGESWNVHVETNIEEAPIELDWQGVDDLPADLVAVLVDPQEGLRIELRSTPGYALPARAVSELRLVVGTPEFLAAQQLAAAAAPLHFQLLPAAPNPVPPGRSISIRFRIPQAAPVTLRIYDALGRLVAVPWEHPQAPPGSYRVRWDGTGEHRQRLASGLYLYRLQAGKLTGSGKILLMR